MKQQCELNVLVRISDIKIKLAKKEETQQNHMNVCIL